MLPRGSARDSSALGTGGAIDPATRSWQIVVCYYVQLGFKFPVWGYIVQGVLAKGVCKT